MNKKVCPKCGKANDTNSNFCIYCGENLVEKQDTDNNIQMVDGLIKCPSCGTLNNPDLFYCKKCGHDLKENKDLVASETKKYKLCPKCKAKNNLDSQFCTNCGYSFDSAINPNIVRCPRCGSTEVELVAYEEGSDFNGANACCGYLACGPLGILFGLTGKDKKRRYVRHCKKCGHEF